MRKEYSKEKKKKKKDYDDKNVSLVFFFKNLQLCVVK